MDALGGQVRGHADQQRADGGLLRAQRERGRVGLVGRAAAGEQHAAAARAQPRAGGVDGGEQAARAHREVGEQVRAAPTSPSRPGR